MAIRVLFFVQHPCISLILKLTALEILFGLVCQLATHFKYNIMNQFISILKWTARIWGSVSFLFLLFMVGAHLMGSLFGGEDGNASGFGSTSEFISFLFFPISTFMGLGLAILWNRVGALITICGMIGLYITRPDLMGDLMIIGIAFPSILYLWYGYLSKKAKSVDS